MLSGLRKLLRLHPERHWVSVPGVIRESNETGERRSQPLIRYTYEYQGRRHSGEAVSAIRERYLGRKGAVEAARKYPVGQDVAVFVNPKDPSQAVLEPVPTSLEAWVATLRGVAGLLVMAVIYLKA